MKALAAIFFTLMDLLNAVLFVSTVNMMLAPVLHEPGILLGLVGTAMYWIVVYPYLLRYQSFILDTCGVPLMAPSRRALPKVLKVTGFIGTFVNLALLYRCYGVSFNQCA